ncbi:MAG: YfhO family protein [Erysipelotrichaceae bacterium]
MIKREKKYLFCLFLLLSFIISVYFFQYVFNSLPVQYGTDIRPQWFLFYEEFKSLISNFLQTGDFPFYSWHDFLGTNFYASKSYYLMGDLFSYIGLLFNTNFFDTALILEILKFFTAGFSMYFLLSKFNLQPKIKIIGSLCYTFSGWSLFFSGQMVFLSFYALVPLYFAGIESYLQDKKSTLFIIMTALCLLTNYYFFFTLSCFTVVYVSYRYYILNDSLEHFMKKVVILIFYYFIGVLISMILTLPTIYYMLGSDRFSGFENGIFFEQIQVYFHEIASFFVPNYLYIYGNNIFETNAHYTREICFYSGSITVLLLPCLNKMKSKFSKATIMVWIVFLFLMIFPMLVSAIHGFGDPSFRWGFFLILFNIITISNILNNVDFYKNKIIIYQAIVLFIVSIIIVPLTAFVTDQNLSNFFEQNLLFLIFGILLIIYALILFKFKKHALTILLFLITIELAFGGFKLFNRNLEISKIQDDNFIQSVTHVLQDYDNQLNSMLDNIEPINSTQYYRTYIPHDSLYWEYSHNMSLVYQLNGTMTYDSAYAPSINGLKKIVPEIKDFESEWIFNIQDVDLLSFLNVKYAIVVDEQELPKGGNWRLLSNNFRDSFLIYRNDDYRNLGTTYSSISLINDFSSTKSLKDTLYVNSEDFDLISSFLKSSSTSILENIDYYNNQLTAYCYSDDDSFMVITLPYDRGWNVKVNGIETKTFEVNGGFIGIPINKGDNTIEMYFTPAGFKVGAILSGIGVLCLLAVIVKNKRKY